MFIANILSCFHGCSLSSRISTQTEMATFPVRSLRASGIISPISASLESLIQTSECGNIDLYTEVLAFMLRLLSLQLLACCVSGKQNLQDQTPDLLCLSNSIGVSNARNRQNKKNLPVRQT